MLDLQDMSLLTVIGRWWSGRLQSKRSAIDVRFQLIHQLASIRLAMVCYGGLFGFANSDREPHKSQ